LTPNKTKINNMIKFYSIKDVFKKKSQMSQNTLKTIRESLMISKIELARKTNIYLPKNWHLNCHILSQHLWYCN